MEFLNTLPNKDKLQNLNLWGNQIKEIDFNWLFTNFPNLKSFNLENNPIKTKNLNNLTSAQFGKLVDGIKEKKMRVNSYKGTVLMDLLDYARGHVARGSTGYSSHLQTLTEIKAKIQPAIREQQQDEKPENQSKNSNTSIYLLVGGLFLLISSVLVIGYWLGKRKKPAREDK